MTSLGGKQRNRQTSGLMQLLIASVIICAVPALTGWCEPHLPGIATASGNARAARSALMAFPVQHMEIEVSEPSMSAMQRLKMAIEQLVAAYLHNQPTDAPLDPEKIEQDLTSLLHVDERDGDDDERYGHEILFKVGLTRDDRRLLHIKGVISVACGNTDAILLVFQVKNGNWSEILRWKNPPYRSVSGALNSLDYVISPQDPAGKWYVLATTVPAWCSSCWGNLNYYILRPGVHSTTPEVSSQGWGPSFFSLV